MDKEQMLELVSIALVIGRCWGEGLPVPVLSAQAKEVEHLLGQVLDYRQNLKNLYD